jgi:hypothetical protein
MGNGQGTRKPRVRALVEEKSPWQLDAEAAEAEAAAERRRLRSRTNQMQRAEAGVHLMCDALSATDKLVVLNACLRDALDDSRGR